MATDSPVQSLPASSLLALSRSAHLPRYSTRCTVLDGLLSPPNRASETQGLARGWMLELSGPPGAGKSRTAMALVLEARVREPEEEVLICDAEGSSLTPSLIARTCRLLAASLEFADEDEVDVDEYALEVLRGIKHQRILDLAGLVAWFHLLPGYLRDNPSIKLVVIDSLSKLFRASSMDYKLRQSISSLMRTTLQTSASLKGVTIVITTTTSLQFVSPSSSSSTSAPAAKRPRTSFARDSEALLAPSLGEAWFVQPTGETGKGAQLKVKRVLLFYGYRGERRASILRCAQDLDQRDQGQEEMAEAAFGMDALGPCDPLPWEPGQAEE